MDQAPSSFTIMATGQLESAEVPGCSNAYCKYQFIHGEDWQLLDGMEEGITQLARVGSGPERMMVWNFPLDVTYKTTNAFGWPQVVVSVYGLDAFGRDVIKGYGSTHLPTCAGRYTLKVRLFKPRSASLLQTFTSWLSGMPAEFADDRFPAYGDGREVTRVQSGGVALLQLNIMTKDMEVFGYSDGSNYSNKQSSVVHLPTASLQPG